MSMKPEHVTSNVALAWFAAVYSKKSRKNDRKINKKNSACTFDLRKLLITFWKETHKVYKSRRIVFTRLIKYDKNKHAPSGAEFDEIIVKNKMDYFKKITSKCTSI